MTLIPELEDQLLALAQRDATATIAGPRRWFGRLRSRRRWPLLAVGWGLVAATVALAAGGVIPIGSPVRDREAAHRRPDVGQGVVVTGSAELLRLRVKDPAGGPPWGMRVINTTRGLGCVQVGRVVSGHLGVLGRDGLFHNDGRFHPLPTTMTGTGICADLDARGRLLTTASAGGVPAAGMTDGACVDPLFTRGVPAAKKCNETDERTIYFGTLGPLAEQLTYANANRSSTTVRLASPHGAYLIVTRRDAQTRFSGIAGGGVEPLNTPIKEVRFRTGLTCAITARGFAAGPRSCPIPGYAPRALPPLTARDVATPVRARVVHIHGHISIAVSFQARLPVADANSLYQATMHAPHATHEYAVSMIDRNVRVGERITFRFPYMGRPGIYTGSVIYVPATGPAARGQRTHELIVGHWSVHAR